MGMDSGKSDRDMHAMPNLEKGTPIQSDQVRCYQRAVYGSSGEIALSYDSSDSFTTSASVYDG